MFTNYIILLGLLLLISMVSCRPSQCQVDYVDFSTKVRDSPIVLFGETMTKNMIPNVMDQFNVTFQVNCIFKGKPTNHTISITQAGYTSGHRYCQDLAAGKTYIVFLEEWKDVYRPVDFQEVEYSTSYNSTLELLEKTCNLTRLSPISFNGTIDKCPHVSTACDEIKMDTTTSSKFNVDSAGNAIDHLFSTSHTIIGDIVTSRYQLFNVSLNNTGHQTYPIHSAQEELDAKLNQQRGKSQFSDEQQSPNSASSIYQNFLLITFFFACVVFVQ
ncbi:unnamed protein product [Didymodactylos carnosus]|uniref:Uncharacterized protein n=1 Tax=Didymodactylos carnosus TaxID=1234261 RepID=A0A813TLB9_9BILA|nr:unnamed protein product [Didymodactylos carnosus]CAF0809869.1 unnamed protein product [Didymodactylos carnosus]CAF3533398.1 unnamed protein product [Didymodactylos carnosus]CAF3595451.1 unnamed protein product [Didymodactylos carnosus]